MKKFSIILSSFIFVILFGLSYSPIDIQGKGEPPVLEKIVFVDKFKKSHVVTGTDPGDCDDTSNKFRTFNGGLKWKTFPVKYHIDTSGFNAVPGTSANQAKAAVERAFETWDAEDHGGDANQFFEEAVSAGTANIRFRWQSIDGEGGTLGTATVSYISNTKTIKSATIILDSNDNWRIFSLACGDQSLDPDILEFDIEDVAAHEVGHAIGFDHVNGKNSEFNTEYPFIIFEGETHKTTLGLGDKLGMKALYDNGGDDNGGGGKCPPGNPSHPKCGT